MPLNDFNKPINEELHSYVGCGNKDEGVNDRSEGVHCNVEENLRNDILSHIRCVELNIYLHLHSDFLAFSCFFLLLTLPNPC